MKRSPAAFAAAALCLLITACGNPSHQMTTSTGTTTEPLTSACPAAGGYMGCAVGSPKTYSATPPSGVKAEPVPTGIRFPDVSDWQGCAINWATVSAPGAAVKLGESDDIVDPCAAHNLTSLKAAGKQRIVYWFVRPVPDIPEAQEIVRALKANGLTINKVVRYGAPGIPYDLSGSFSTWEADYSSVREAWPARTTIAAWQYTDAGYIAGLGYGDVSVSYGLLADSPHVLVLDEEVPGISGYAPTLARYVLAHDPVPSAPKPSGLPHPASYYRVFLDHTFTISHRKLNERTTVETFDRKPSAALRADLRQLADRIYRVAHVAPNGHRYRRAQWGVSQRGLRYQRLGQRLHPKR